MSRKRDRDRAFSSRHIPYSYPKRRRPLPKQPDAGAVDDIDQPSSGGGAKQPATVTVLGIPSDCSVLDLKSRFEIYGPISRTRMDPSGAGYITFRSRDDAQAAVSAAVDPSFPVTVNSIPVQVMWASDPVPQWREGVVKKVISPLSSKLVRPEVPLSKRGRGNKLRSTIVIPRNNSNNGHAEDFDDDDGGDKVEGVLVKPFMGRQVVSYDDIL